MRFIKSKAVRVLGVIFLMLSAAVALIVISEMYVRTKVPVSLYGQTSMVTLWDRGYASFEGTWIIEGEAHAFPLNKSTIVCRAETKQCTDSSARVQLFGQPQLDVIVDTHDIVKWDDDTLIYTTAAPQCAEYIYTASRATKQVSGIRTLKAPVDGVNCPDMKKELRLRLVNGFEVYLQMQKDARPVAFNVAALLAILAFGAVWIVRIVRRPSIGP